MMIGGSIACVNSRSRSIWSTVRQRQGAGPSAVDYTLFLPKAE